MLSTDPRSQPDLATENARLRSANAKLVEACRRAEASFTVHWGRHEDESTLALVPSHWRDAWDQLVDAIAEAEAEAQP